MEPFSFNIKKLLIFSQKKVFFIFWETIPYVSRNGTFLYFRGEFANPEKQKMTADLVCTPNLSNNEFLAF